MGKYFSNKRMGFYLTAIAAILEIIGLISYSSAETPNSTVFALVIAAIAVEVVMIVIGMAKEDFALMNLTATVNTILMAAAVVTSLWSQVDYLGWVVSGLYTMDQVMNYLIFAGVGVAALLLNIIASFLQWHKEPSLV